ncbi:hypothetical protein [Paenibacillus lautus]|uniref:hypothetical protein n=1 Tax=Paenibacillus lautus TaxID=1401 RepID=UPI001BCB5831|nr:hypothetical protein [Paenibacillus lautus]
MQYQRTWLITPWFFLFTRYTSNHKLHEQLKDRQDGGLFVIKGKIDVLQNADIELRSR